MEALLATIIPARARLVLLLGLLAVPAGIARPAAAQIPTWSEQIRIRESWLPDRHRLLLDLMRKHDVQMWIVANEEFHDDPITQYIAPPRPYTGNRDYFIFVDTGGTSLRKVAVTGFSEENLQRFFENPDEPKSITTVLPALYNQHKPKRIALNIGGGRGV